MLPLLRYPGTLLCRVPVCLPFQAGMGAGLTQLLGLPLDLAGWDKGPSQTQPWAGTGRC